MKDLRYSWLLLLLCNNVVCESKGHVNRQFHFEATSLTEGVITVNVHSDVTGSIVWRQTNDQHFKISMKVTGDTSEDLNNTDILFLADNGSVRLLVQDKPTSSAHAPITGSGNRLSTSLLLIISAVAGLMPCKATYLLPWILFNTLAQGDTTLEPPHSNQKSVSIEIQAPSRFTYGDVSLYVFMGEVTIQPDSISKITTFSCHTSASEGCPQCCHGNGACIHNRCQCRKGYNMDTFCATKTRQDIFYSHPMDPRLETVILPTRTSLTLSRSYNTPEAEKWSYLLYPENLILDVRDSETGVLTHRVQFSSNGFIKEILDYNSNNVSNKVVLKRNRVDKCKMKILFASGDNEQRFNFHTCDASSEDKKMSPPSIKMGSNLQRHSLQKQNLGQVYQTPLMAGRVRTVDIPVSVQRCGHNTDDIPRVLMKLTTLDDKEIRPITNGRNRGDANDSTSHQYYPKDDVVVIRGAKDTRGAPVIRIPDTKYTLEDSAIENKCSETFAKRQSLCRESHLRDYSKVCDFLSYKEVTLYNTSAYLNDTIIQYSNTCHVVVQLLYEFCDRNISDKFPRGNECLLHYSSTINLFENGNYKFTPYAVFSDGKTVSGPYQFVYRNSRAMFRNEISIIDTKPDFKIDKLSVIPSDPVPHDIYQVRLDYSCATNTTIIKMTVTGSDKYSNHVTCHGGSISGTCTLHAAGAPDAVVDNVKIKITDAHTGFQMTKEVVIII